MSSTLGVAIMMNNYFHDVATALLIASAATLWFVMRAYDSVEPTPATGRLFLALYARMTGLARFALLWIIVGGVPRLWAYEDFEWANAAGKAQVPALIVKHIIAFALVGAGAHLWLRLRRRVQSIRASFAGELADAPPT